MNRTFNQRRAGILLHITSLPGPGSVGDLGSNAYRFVDFLAACGMTVWQILPIGPTMSDNSPYQSTSAYAGNPRLISLDLPYERGWIDSIPEGFITDEIKKESIGIALKGFEEKAKENERNDYNRFVNDQKHWLDDYALFQALHQESNKPWWEWDQALRDRYSWAIDDARSRLSETIKYIRFEQYLFFVEWMRLKRYANEKKVLIFGDVPIFVSHDSSEVWAHRECFDLLDDGHLRVTGGVPPDYFSETGQCWGNPLYRWDVLEKDGFKFWVDRLRYQSTLFNLTRIDHFRGFEAYWEIPGDFNAMNGKWVKAPGHTLFQKLYQEIPGLELVAEDLGIITEEVTALRDCYDLPGMKILHFAFSGGSDNPYLPHNHTENSIVYTGTHDNDTTMGWYHSMDDGSRNHVNNFLGNPQENMPWALIHCAMESRANMAIIPLQDFLELGTEHRMNTPGTCEGNWGWRFCWGQINSKIKIRLLQLVEQYGRK